MLFSNLSNPQNILHLPFQRYNCAIIFHGSANEYLLIMTRYCAHTKQRQLKDIADIVGWRIITGAYGRARKLDVHTWSLILKVLVLVEYPIEDNKRTPDRVLQGFNQGSG